MLITIVCFLTLVKVLSALKNNSNPLILTDLIKNGNTETARNLSIVSHPIFQNVTSFSGFFRVNKTHNSNIFFWFFPSKTNYKKSPVVLWLNGGPGTSSLYGLFTENGPFEVTNDFKINLRNTSWSKITNLLYIDNPVGTGFSFTDSKGYLKNEYDIGDQLHEALDQFFDLFAELRGNDFFITGESYGGKYIPATAYTILNKNLNAHKIINLKGVAIGNGWIDPRNQLEYGEYLYQNGLFDLEAKNEMEILKKSCQQSIDKGKNIKASLIYSSMINLFLTTTGYTNLYNYLDPKDTIHGPMEDFIEKDEIKNAIHVGNLSYNDGKMVFLNLLPDFMASSTHFLRYILDHIPVYLYSGQVDFIVNYASTLNFLSKFTFNAANEYKHAVQNIWKIDDEIAGYFKVAGNLTVLLVRNAGHMVPQDQPELAFDLINRITRKIKFNEDYSQFT